MRPASKKLLRSSRPRLKSGPTTFPFSTGFSRYEAIQHAAFGGPHKLNLSIRRHSKLGHPRLIRFPRRLLSLSGYHSASTHPYRPECTRKPWKSTTMYLRRLEKRACPETFHYTYRVWLQRCPSRLYPSARPTSTSSSGTSSNSTHDP
jgi:hypothetical protein